MRVMVVDGQGGGLGKAIVEKLCAVLPALEILAVGTNSAATAAMLKAGATAAATGENAVIYNAAHAEVIAGGAGILCANAMMGEISAAMAAAVSGSEAIKVIVPMDRCGIRVCGTEGMTLPGKIDAVVAEVQRIAAERA